MKKTALHSIHKELGARMISFSGYEMPMQYSGIISEHKAVRNSVGVFDVSHMGEFIVEGKKAIDLLQYLCSNDISKLYTGKAQYNCLLNNKGGIIDDLIIYQLATQKYLLVVNAANIQKDWNWIVNQNTKYKAKLTNITDSTSLLSIQGPKALKIIDTLTPINIQSIRFYEHRIGYFAGVPDVIIATTGYTGSGGVELYFPAEYSQKIWKAVFLAGAPYKIVPVGLAARDTLRLEMGYCLYGNELNDNITPYEAGLGWITKPHTQFINAQHLLAIKNKGIQKKLVAFILKNKGIPRTDYEITNKNGKNIGKVTSGTLSPNLNIGIGLGYVNNLYASVGNEIFIKIREKLFAADIVKLPFYQSKKPKLE